MRGALLAGLLSSQLEGDQSPPVESVLEIQAKREASQRQVMRDQSLRYFLKRKRTKQPSHNCSCGKTISGNKQHCAKCAAGRALEQ